MVPCLSQTIFLCWETRHGARVGSFFSKKKGGGKCILSIGRYGGGCGRGRTKADATPWKRAHLRGADKGDNAPIRPAEVLFFFRWGIQRAAPTPFSAFSVGRSAGPPRRRPTQRRTERTKKTKKGPFSGLPFCPSKKKIKRVWRVNTHDRAVAPKDNRRSLRANTIGRTMSAPDRGNLFFFLSFRWVCTALCSAALHSPMFLFFLPPIWCGLSSLGEDKRGAAAVWGFVASVIVVVVVVVMR